MSDEFDSSDLSRIKRRILPDDFGSECPMCGEPFDAGSSGFKIVDGEGHSVDCFTWVRACSIPNPEEHWSWFEPKEGDFGFTVVHKDEHIRE